MNRQWADFLRAQGAAFDGDRVTDFGDPARERDAAPAGDCVVDLSHLALVRVSGSDSTTFLNGQLTNDIQRVDTAHSQLSAWCSPKGRMLALFRVMESDQSFLLQLPTVLREQVIKRLRMYVLRAKVAIETVDDELVHFGVAGQGSAARLREMIGSLPSAVNHVLTSGGLICVRLHGPIPRFEIVGTPDAAGSLWAELTKSATRAGAAAWDRLDILAGIPTVLPQTSDAFVPQMANLDAIDGVSFDKGCYTGQEIVARVHYRGRVKQRMYRAHVEDAAAPQPGDSVFASELPGQSAGTVVIAAASPEGGNDLLAVIQSDSVARGELHLYRADGPTLAIQSLPYRLPD